MGDKLPGWDGPAGLLSVSTGLPPFARAFFGDHADYRFDIDLRAVGEFGYYAVIFENDDPVCQTDNL
jgi:hypothetical protein